MADNITTTSVVLLLVVLLCIAHQAIVDCAAQDKTLTGILIVGQSPSQTFDPIGSPHVNGNISTGILPAMQFGTATLMPYSKMFFVKGERVFVRKTLNYVQAYSATVRSSSVRIRRRPVAVPS